MLTFVHEGGLFQDDNTPSIRHEGSLNGLMSMKMMWIICYHTISTQLNSYGKFWIDMLDSALHHHHQNIKLGNILWKNSVHPSSRVQRLVESMPKCFDAVWWQVVAQHLTKTLHVSFFRVICHSSVYINGSWYTRVWNRNWVVLTLTHGLVDSSAHRQDSEML